MVRDARRRWIITNFPLPTRFNASIFFSHHMNSRIFQLIIVSVFALAHPLFSAEMVVGNIRVIKVEGNSAEMIEASGAKSAVKEGVFIRQGTKIITGPDSRVDLVFENGSAVNISPSSQFSIDEFIQDPFNSDGLDYKAVKQAPTTSVTKISIPEGEIYFEVAKQKPGSSFEITTPVGTAGIRGTSGFAGARGFGLATGFASFLTPAGNTVNVGAGTQVNPNGASGAASPGAINAVNAAVAEMQITIPPNTFGGSPPNLLPQQQRALDAAVEKGADAILTTAENLATATPENSPDIARMASILAPAQVLEIASRVAEAAPAFAPQIAASVSLTFITQAPQIAAAVSEVVPTVAPQIAAEVVKVAPNLAPQVAAAVAQVVPQQIQNISNAVMDAVPSADAAVIQKSAEQGASQSTQQGGPSSAGANNRPQPSDNAVIPPQPPTQARPTPTPTPNPSAS